MKRDRDREVGSLSDSDRHKERDGEKGQKESEGRKKNYMVERRGREIF